MYPIWSENGTKTKNMLLILGLTTAINVFAPRTPKYIEGSFYMCSETPQAFSLYYYYYFIYTFMFLESALN